MGTKDENTPSGERPPPGQRVLPLSAKGRRPQYFADPATDKLLSMVVTLMGELSVTRDRLDTVEELLQREGVLARDAIDAFLPDGEVARRREHRRAEFTARVLRVLEAELDELQAGELARGIDDLDR